MERLKEFFRSKGFYIAMGTGVAALATLLLFYNYTGKKSQFRKEQALDLNQPINEQLAKNNQDENVRDASSSGVIKKDKNGNNTASAEVAKEEESSEEGTENKNNSSMDATSVNTEKETAGNLNQNIDPTSTDNKDAIDNYIAKSEIYEDVSTPVMNYDGGQYLYMPVEGEVIIPYSMDTTVYFKTLDTYKCNPGMLIKAEEGEDVHSTYEGVVEKVEDTKEYGTIVTIDMGNGYKAKYGQLMNLTVKEGDSVGMAMCLGEVAPVSTYYSEEGNHLYFEIDKDDKPVNPNGLFRE